MVPVQAQIPLWVKRMGGMAVVKVPYANAGQGVWTIVNDEELAAFMLITHHYSAFIVQARSARLDFLRQVACTAARMWRPGIDSTIDYREAAYQNCL